MKRCWCLCSCWCCRSKVSETAKPSTSVRSSPRLCRRATVLLFATVFFVTSTRPPVAINHGLVCVGLTHRSISLFFVTYVYRRPPSITNTHERIEYHLVATMSTVARGGSRGGRGRGQSTGVWRGSNTRGGHNGASTDSSDKPAFGAKKRGGGVPNGGSNKRNTTSNDGQESGEDGKPKKK